MKLSRFVIEPEGSIAGLDQLDTAFWEQESILPEDIDRIAETMAAGLEATVKGNLQIVIYPLSGSEYMADELQFRTDPNEAPADVGPYTSALRAALGQRLGRLLPNVVLLDRPMAEQESNRIVATADGNVLKLPTDWNTDKGSKDSATRKTSRLAALQLLYSLPEHSPHIAYNITHIEEGSEPQAGIQLQRKLQMQTFYDLLYENPPKQGLPLEQALRYVSETLDGCAFLVDHGLRLTDLSPHNIGIDQTSDHAFLFDMDGLIKEGVPLENYRAQDDFWPPERRSSPYSENQTEQTAKPVTEAEMVFELGQTLRRICSVYQIDEYDACARLRNMMSHPDAQRRPTIRQAQAALEDIRMSLAA